MILIGLVDCRECREAYEGQWTADADTVQDLDEPPAEEQTCPGCGSIQQETWPGWTNHTLAG